MRLCTLGGLRLEGSKFERPKPLLLLAYLALEGSKDRRFLSELFWPTAASPMTSLRTTLRRLRQNAPGIVAGEAQLSTKLACDARELLELIERGEFEKVRAAYKGPFLQGFYLEALGVELEEWIYATREFIAARLRESLLKLAEGQAAEGNFAEAARLAEEAYWLSGAPEPDPEHFLRIYQLLMAGESSRAGEVKHEAESFGLTLTVSSEEAKARLKPLAPLGNFSAHPTTSFVGRGLELVEVMNLLAQEDCRLLTLVGVGGMGKTRLALKVAQERQESFAEGVYVVNLSALYDPRLIPSTIASALGLTLPGDQPLAGLLSLLKDKHLLLVLDNFEQLTEGAYMVSQLLQHCPKLKLLVTSRERLSLAEEWIFPVQGFPVPDALEEAEQVDAVKLFWQRAKRVRLDFSLRENLAHVLKICRLVDGSPLGIELAATWVRMLPVEEIAGELEQSLDLLESSERNVSERHRSIRATVGYSWKLLSSKEREVLRKLSVFRGGFTREAAAKVVGATISLLAALVDKSLLRLLPNGRYDRHLLLYQYTQEKLAEHRDEQLETQAEHAAYFLALAEEAEPRLMRPEQVAYLQRLETEHDNLRAALSWALDHDPELGLRLAGALWRFWYTHSHLSEGRRWLETVLVRANRPLAARAKALNGAGSLAYYQHDMVQASAFQEEALALWRELGDERGIASSLHELACVVRYQQDEARAVRLFEESLTLLRKVGDMPGIAWSLHHLGMLTSGDDPVRVVALCEESLAIFRQLGNRGSIAAALNNLGLAECSQGNHERAVALCSEGLALYQELGNKYGISWALENLAAIAQRQGELERAAALFAEELALARELASETDIASALRGLAGTHGLQGDLERAARLYGVAEAVRPASSVRMLPRQRADYERAVASLRIQMGERSFAQAWAAGKAMALDKVIAYAMEVSHMAHLCEN